MTALTQKNAKNHYRSHKRALIVRNTFVYILLIAISIFWLIPFLYLFFQSFSSLYAPAYFLPYVNTAANKAAGYPIWTGSNYVRLFTDANYTFWRWWLNTFIIAFVSAVLNTIFVLGTSYAFSRLRFGARKPIMKLILILGMFPGFLSMIIIYFILKLIHLETNIYSLILINVAGSAMSYYIAKGFFDTVPKSLDEAAMIDGANKNTIFFRVIMPLSKPIVVYTLLLSFTGPWGDFMMASYLSLGRNNSMTVAVGLQQMLSLAEKQTYFGVFCAGGVLVAVPIMILFFWLQRYYVEGITGGAVKG
jgi:arabinogalactan oligomer/maltooligosaccharide transport system permease protein